MVQPLLILQSIPAVSRSPPGTPHVLGLFPAPPHSHPVPNTEGDQQCLVLYT